jgi:bifunctional non-homologous end joining protein LigD
MGLREYRSKRCFKATPEPPGRARKRQDRELTYVIQKHRASHLHFDFRLERDGVLVSWAVPKAPSLDPREKRLARRVEDHPLEYATFEGCIPEGQYGGGTVMVWDRGTWTPRTPHVAAALKAGELSFELHGRRLRGTWVLVRLGNRGKGEARSWLLIKRRDPHVSDTDITQTKARSVVTRRTLAQIARDTGCDVEKAATGDPESAKRTRDGSAALRARPKRQPTPKARRSP